MAAPFDERLWSRGPVDRVAARVVRPGVSYTPPSDAILATTVHSKVPLTTRPVTERSKALNPSFEDLTGRQIGRLTVIGLSALHDARWVVRCACGDYELRKARVIKNPHPDEHGRCSACMHLERQRVAASGLTDRQISKRRSR